MKMKTITLYVLALCAASFQLPGANLSLTIVDQNGNAVAGASVSGVRQSIYLSAGPLQLAPGEVDFRALWTTDNSGTIQASGVPAGNYLLCVTKPNSPLLDPCIWAKPIQVNSLQSGEQRSLVNIAVPLGSLVQISVSDAATLLPQWADLASDGGLIVGAYHSNQDGNQIWTPAIRNVNKTFSVAIPTGTPYRLWVFSREFNFSVPGVGATSGPAVSGVNSTSSNGILSPSVVAGTEPIGGYQVTTTSAKN